ncbi:YTH domain-containing protein 1-like isoform X2 [Euwallacea fornicatus]|uniref:YTH domain-containing protein 1-like isoform X2 n=1 Tax=Euwallacea fornicatus TaxID=995702 RepID=UPI00338F0F47
MRFQYKSVAPTATLNSHFTFSDLPPPISVLPEKYPSQISSYPLSLSPNALVPSMEKKMEYPDDPIFVLIKAREKKNIDIAQKTYKWVFSPQTEKKVIGFQGGKKIYLVFFVKEIQMFMGIAQYKSMNFGKKYFKPTATISWIFNSTLNKNNTRHLLNPYNSGKPIYEGCDGQIIKTDIGEELLRIYSESTRGKL